MEIKNKIVNTKDYKKSLKLNKKMKKKSLKFKNKDINECTPLEQSLFFSRSSKDVTTKPDKNKYLKINKHITLLYTFPKSNIDFIISNILKLLYENPMEKNIFSSVIDNQYIKRIKNYNNYHDYQSFGSIGHICPKKLKKYVEYIQMTIFNFSKNYFGIAFECTLNNEIFQELNNLLICDIDDYSEYNEYYIGNKKQIGKLEWNPDIIRQRKFENSIIEIKCKIHNFLTRYFKFDKKLIKAPVSINLFETNYDITEFPSSFMTSHRIYGYINKYKLENFSIWESFPNKSDSTFKTDVCFECYHLHESLDRSSNIYIYSKTNKKDLSITPDYLINLYILTLHFYKLCELEEVIIKRRNDIFSIYNKRNNKIYSSYNDFSKEILKIKTSLSNIAYGDSHYSNEYIKKCIKNQQIQYEELISESKEFENYFENKLSIQNIRDSRKISYISIIIAFISLLVAIVPIIYNNSNEKKINETITNNSSYIKQIKENTIQIKENIKDIVIQTEK